MMLPRSPASLLFVPLLAACLLWAPSTAHAGPIGLEAFGPEAVLTNFNGLPLEMFDNPSPLVIDDNTYSSSDGFFHYFIGYGTDETLNTNGDQTTLTVILAQDATRVGALVGAFGASSATARFYDATNTLLGFVDVTTLDVGLSFVGWETTGALIHSVQFEDTAVNELVLALDNFITESSAVPEPGTLALLGFGMAGLALRRRHGQTR